MLDNTRTSLSAATTISASNALRRNAGAFDAPLAVEPEPELPTELRDVSDHADAMNAFLRRLGFDESCREPVSAAVGYANGRTGEISAPDHLLGRRLGGNSRRASTASLAKRWRRAYDRLDAHQRASGIVLVERLAGGRDAAGQNQPSRIRVPAVAILAEVVERARQMPGVHGKSDRRRAEAFERAARAVKIKPVKNSDRARDRFGNRPRQDEGSVMSRELSTIATLTKKVAERARRNEASAAELERLRERMRSMIEEAFGEVGAAVHSPNEERRTETGHAGADSAPAPTDTNPRPPCVPFVEPESAQAAAVTDGWTKTGPKNIGVFADSDSATAEAEATISAFESVGATSFATTLLDEASGKVLDFATFIGDGLRLLLPPLLRRNAAHSQSIIVRPQGAAFLQADDLPLAKLAELEHLALTTETSDGNGQAWFALRDVAEGSPEHKELQRRLKDGLKSDKGASGAMRIPGSINRKPARDGFRIRLASVRPGKVTVAELERAGLLAPMPPAPARHRAPANRACTFPDYGKCVAAKEGDRSRADASFVKIAMERGFAEGEAWAELERVAPRPKLQRADYQRRTLEFAQA